MERRVNWHGVFGAALAALRRFPAAIALAFVASSAFWLQDARQEAVVEAALRAFPWAVALRLFAESYLPVLRAVLPWTALLLAIPSTLSGMSSWMLGGAGLLAIVSALPRFGERDANGLWVQSLSVVIGLGMAAVVILVIGWLVIQVITRSLFEAVLPGGEQVAAQIAFLFGPWLTLALWRGHREAPMGWPPLMSGLLNWMLVPITFVCVALLNLYCLQIAVAGDLPKGVIASITVGVTIGGGLVWALACGSEAKGAGSLARSFWLLLLLPTGALILAAWQRVAQYGVTEERYLLFVCAGIVLVLAGAQVVRRTLPTPSLVGMVGMLALIVAAVGPWSATAVSVRSQFTVLIDALAEAGLMRDGQIILRDSSEPRRSVPSAASALRFLVERGRDDLVVERLVGSVDLPNAGGVTDRSKRVEQLASAMGLSLNGEGRCCGAAPTYVWRSEDANYFHIGRGRRALIDVEGYAFATPVMSLRGQVVSSVTLDTSSGLLDIMLTPDGVITARFGADDEARFDLIPPLRRHESDKSSPIIVKPGKGQIPTRLILHSADWIVSMDGDVTIQKLEAQLLIGHSER